MFRYKFTDKSVADAIRFLKTKKGVPPTFVQRFKDDLTFKGSKLYYNNKEVISQERRDDVFREELYKKKSDVPTARDSGFHILKQRFVGLSKNKLNEFIRKQKPLGQVKQSLAKPKVSGGPKLKGYTFECDLVFLRKNDLEKANKKFIRDDIKNETYFLTVCEKLSGLSNYAYVQNKDAKDVTPLVIKQCKKIAKQLGTKLSSCQMNSDAGGEFDYKVFKKEFRTAHTVKVAPAVENKNKMFQQNFFKILRQRKATEIVDAMEQTEVIMNNTFNKFHKDVPTEVAKKSRKDLISTYNKTRKTHVAGDNRGEFDVGQHVRLLLKEKKGKLGYKTYKDETFGATVYKITKKTKTKPTRYFVNGKWYLQASLEKSAPRDEKSNELLKQRDEEFKEERDEEHVEHLKKRIIDDSLKKKKRPSRQSKKNAKYLMKQQLHVSKQIDDNLDSIEEGGEIKPIKASLPKVDIQKARVDKYREWLKKHNKPTNGNLKTLIRRIKFYKAIFKRAKNKKT